MKTFLPWLCALAFGAGAVHFLLEGGKKETELALLRPQAAEAQNLQAELANARASATGQAAEIDRLKKETEDVMRLRNEVRQLRDESHRLNQQLQSASAAASQQAQQIKTANERLQSAQSAEKQANAALLRDACVSRMREIDTLKKNWAMVNKKTAQDTPAPEELAQMLKGGSLPTCPAGGTYTLGTVEQFPACPIAGHHP